MQLYKNLASLAQVSAYVKAQAARLQNLRIKRHFLAELVSYDGVDFSIS
jgi:hypothetical protein